VFTFTAVNTANIYNSLIICVLHFLSPQGLASRILRCILNKESAHHRFLNIKRKFVAVAVVLPTRQT
jgi:hypothetical protein